ncbi:ABC transporter G family member 3-like [Corylus avellana]|uniref:ABC transporter G family member 3-like n=1 Tax=Corylus avellana TaxID=13451 RepID=UPI00286CDE90|nr:ABC transporter G family member 3-like [Corylus avellana]
MASLLQPNTSHYEVNQNPRAPRSTSLEVETIDIGLVPAAGNRGGNVVVRSMSVEDGVFLTWEDLWVTVSNKKSGSRSILAGVSGFARPGELLAIMGPSGCGKSTLLDALAGRLESNIRQSGEILINGHKQALAYGTSAYVTQDDTLMTTLTVKEAVNYSAHLQLPDSMSKSEKRERADTIITEMGLQDAMNTRIGGGWGAKGISGGSSRSNQVSHDMFGLSIKVEILFKDITATREGSWAPSIGLVPNDIGVIDGVDVMVDEDGNILEGLDVLDDKPNLNTHGIDDIPTDLDTRDKENKKFGLAVQCKNRKKRVQIVSQHLSRICDAIESKNTVTSKSNDKPGCNIEEVMDVVWGIAERENDIDILKFAAEVFLRDHIERCL